MYRRFSIYGWHLHSHAGYDILWFGQHTLYLRFTVV
jgi:hypothetical protein